MIMLPSIKGTVTPTKVQNGQRRAAHLDLAQQGHQSLSVTAHRVIKLKMLKNNENPDHSTHTHTYHLGKEVTGVKN